jgi:hypothetical protein
MSGAFDQIARDADTTEAALVALHDAGASPVQALEALVHGRGLTLRDAKLALASSPAWEVEVRAAEPLWDELIDEPDTDRDDPGT